MRKGASDSRRYGSKYEATASCAVSRIDYLSAPRPGSWRISLRLESVWDWGESRYYQVSSQVGDECVKRHERVFV